MSVLCLLLQTKVINENNDNLLDNYITFSENLYPCLKIIDDSGLLLPDTESVDLCNRFYLYDFNNEKLDKFFKNYCYYLISFIKYEGDDKPYLINNFVIKTGREKRIYYSLDNYDLVYIKGIDDFSKSIHSLLDNEFEISGLRVVTFSTLYMVNQNKILSNYIEGKIFFNRRTRYFFPSLTDLLPLLKTKLKKSSISKKEFEDNGSKMFGKSSLDISSPINENDINELYLIFEKYPNMNFKLEIPINKKNIKKLKIDEDYFFNNNSELVFFESLNILKNKNFSYLNELVLGKHFGEKRYKNDTN